MVFKRTFHFFLKIGKCRTSEFPPITCNSFSEVLENSMYEVQLHIQGVLVLSESTSSKHAVFFFIIVRYEIPVACFG